MGTPSRLVAAIAVSAALALAVPLAEATTPTILSATATAPNQITVTFSEPVKTEKNARTGWSAAGGDLGSLRISVGTSLNLDSGTDTVVFTLNGNLPDTTPDGITLSYATTGFGCTRDTARYGIFAQYECGPDRLPAGDIADLAGNKLAARSGIPVSDGIAPAFTARATSLNTIAVTFSETIGTGGAAAGTWTLSGDDAGSRTVSSQANNPTALTISADLADRNPDLLLTYNRGPGDLADSAGNEPGGTVRALDRIAPLAPSITTATGAVVTAPSIDVAGTAEAGSRVAVYVGGSAARGTVTAGADGSWAKAVPLASGDNTITAKATDRLGNESPASTSITARYNPSGTVITTPPSEFTVASQAISGVAPTGSSVSLYRQGDTTALGTDTADASTGAWSISATLEAGRHAYYAESTKAGATVRSGAVTFEFNALTNSVAPVSSVQDGEGIFTTLGGPRDVKILEQGGKTYALVAAGSEDGLQLIDVSDPREAAAVSSTRTSGIPYDIEIADVGSKKFALVATHRGGAVDIFDITNIADIQKARTVKHDALAPDGSAFSQLRGAKDLDYFSVNSKHYAIVAADAGKTTLFPGGFLIMEFNENVATDGTPTAPNFKSVYHNHQKQTDSQGREVLYAQNRGGYGQAMFDPFAYFDADGDPIPVTRQEKIRGYGDRLFDVPLGGVSIQTWVLTVEKGSSWTDPASRNPSTDPAWKSLVDSQGRPRGTDADGHPTQVPGSRSETAPSRVLVMNNNGTADKSDDWLEASFGYGYEHGSLFRNPISERKVPDDGTSKLVSVDASGSPFTPRGQDSAGAAFAALEGASSVDTFTVTKDGATKTYAAIAAEVSDGVQIIDVSDPADPRAVKHVLDGDLDPGGRAFAELDGATGIETVTVGTKVYAVVASYDDDGFQVIDLSDPASPRATAHGADTPGRGQGRFATLDGATSVHTFSRTVAGADRTYAMITATGYDEDRGGGGFQLVDITNPAAPTPAGNGRDGERCSTASRYNAMGGATSADTAVIGGKLYSVVTGMFDDGIQLVQMDMSRRGSTLVVADAILDDTGGYFALGAPRSSTVAEINGRTYVFAGSYKEEDGNDGGRVVGEGGGVQIIDVTNPALPKPAAGLVDSDHTPFNMLKGVGDIDVFQANGRSYAIVTAQGEYGHEVNGEALAGAFMILDVTNPETPRRVAGVLAGQPYSGGGSDQTTFMMSGPIGVDTAEINGRTYAAIASNYAPEKQKAGVSIVDVTNPASPKPMAWIEDDSYDGGRNQYSLLDRPNDIEIFSVGTKTYAIATSPPNNAVTIIDISNPAVPKLAGTFDSFIHTQRARTVSVVTMDNSHTGGEKTYAAVVGGTLNNAGTGFGYLSMIDVTDPSSPNRVQTVHKGQSGTFDISGAYGVDTYHLGGKTYAAVSCGIDIAGAYNECNGVTVLEITDPDGIAQRGKITDESNTFGHSIQGVHMLDSRGIDTFVSGTAAYSASVSFGDSGMEIARLGTATDGAAPAMTGVTYNPDRGILEIAFNELIRTSSGNVDLGKLAVNSAAGSSSAGRLSGATLITASDAKTMSVSVSDAQKTAFATLFASAPYPGLDVTAGAFDDQAGNDVQAMADVAIRRVETAPVLLESVLEMGPGTLRLFFSEAVDVTPASGTTASPVDLSKFKVYDPEKPAGKIALSGSRVANASDDSTLVVRLDEAARSAISALGTVPVIDLEAGAVRSSEGGHASEGQPGNPFNRVYGDSTPPRLVSAVRDSSALVLTFTEKVKVEAQSFDLDQIRFYRDGQRGSATYLDDGGGLPDASLSTTADSDTVRIALTPAQTAAIGTHKDLVLETVLDEGLSAVEDLFGYGIGEARAPLRNPDGTGPALDSSEAPAFGSVGGTLTVTFSEGLWQAETDPSKFHVRDGAGVSSASGQVTPTPAELRAGAEGSDAVKFHLSEESAAAIEAMSDPHLYLDSGAAKGADSDPSAAASAGRDVSEPSQARPSISSASAQDLGAIRIDFTKPVKSEASAQQLLGAWSLSGPDSVRDGLPLTVLSTTTLSSATESLVLTLQGRLPSLSPDASVVYDAEKAPIADAADSALTLSSATAPLRSAAAFAAEATASDKITVVFSEPVTEAGATSGPGGWSISGPDAGGLRVLERTDISVSSSTLVLTLDGHLTSTKPSIFLNYDASMGEVRNARSEVSGSVQVSDGLAPRISSAAAVSLTEIRVEFSEPLAIRDTAARGWSVSGTDAASHVVVSSTTASDSDSIVLTLDKNLADTKPDGVLLRYETSGADVGGDAGSGSGAIADTSSNPLAARANIPVSDGVAPAVLSSAITGPNRITVEYSEAVTAARAGYASATMGTPLDVPSTCELPGDPCHPPIQEGSAWTGTPHAVSSLSGSGTAVHTVEFEGEVGTDAIGFVTINSAQVVDGAGNALGALPVSPVLSDGQAPTIESATAIEQDKIAVMFSENMVPDGTVSQACFGLSLQSDPQCENPASYGAAAQGWSVSGGDAAGRQVVSGAGSGRYLVLTLDADLADTGPDGVLLQYKTSPGDVGTDADSGSGRLADLESNALAAASSIAVSDSLAPTVSAKYTSRDSVDLEFSEPVRLSSAGPPTGWTVSGADSGAATGASSVSVITASVTSTSATLTLNGDLADKTNLDFTLAYAAGGNIEDQSGNTLAPYSAKPADGIAPKVSSAEVTGPTTITITYGEAVTAGDTAYSPPAVDNFFRTISGVSGNGTDTHAITYGGGNPVGTGATGHVFISEAEVRDASGNAMGTGAPRQDLADGQKPAVLSAEATAPDKITVTFSENLSISDETARGWSVSGGDAAGRTVDSSTAASDGDSVVLTLSSDMEDTKPDGVLLRYETSGADVGGDAGSGSGAIADTSSNALAARAGIAVSDGIAPEISSATYTGRDSVDLEFSEPVRLSSAGPPTGWTVSGADKGDATAASAVSVITASATSASATLTLDGDLADKTLLDFTLEYAASSGNIEDESGNALAAYSEKPNDGIGPTILSSRITGHHEITFVYSEAVTADQSAYSSALIRTSRETTVTVCEEHGDHFHCQTSPPPEPPPDPYDISSLSGNGTAVHTLEIDGEVGTEATGFMFILSNLVIDGAGNALGDFPLTPALTDGQAPEIESATATGSNEITVEFSEDLAPYGAVAQGWSISGADAAGLHVSSSTAAHADSIVLTLDGDLAGTKPDGVELRYKTSPGDVGTDADSGSGRIADLESNALVAFSSMTVSDGLEPTVSAKYTSRNSVALEFSEPVWLASGSAPTGWTVSGSDRGAATEASAVSVITTSVTSTSATLTLDGNLADKTLLDFTLEYDEGAGNIEDESGNHLADYSDAPSDGIAPRIASAQPNALDAITVAFSEDVDATPTSATATWTLGGSNLPPGVEVSANPAISTGVTVLTLSGDLNDPVGNVTLTYNDGPGDAQDKSGNALAAQTVQLDQNLPPSVSSARITGPGAVEIKYSEPVTAVAADYMSLVVDGQARDVSGLSGGTTAVHTISFTGGTPPGGDATGSISIDAQGVKDATDKALGTGAISQHLSDGQSPTVSSAKYTSRNSVDLEFSEPVRLSSGNTPTEWTVSGADSGAATGASSVSVITASVTSTSATLTLDGDLADKTLLDFTLSYAASGNIEDGGGNALVAYSATPDDGIAPTVSSAKYTSRNSVDLEFSEPVRLSSGNTPTEWTVSGADVGSATGASSAVASGSTAPISTSAAASEVTLNLDADLADKTLLDFTLSYAASGNIEDGGGNALGAYSAKPSDGFAPTILSTKVTSSNEITITFSEPVVTIVSHYSSSVNVGGSGHFVTGSETGTVERVILRFTGAPFGADAIGDMTVDTTQVKDQAGNALGTEAARPLTLTDGQSPAISSAKATGPRQITVEFSENLASYGTNAQGWSVSGGDAAGRQVVSGAGSGNSLVLTLNADLDDTRPDGVTLRYKTSPGDVDSDADSGSGALQDGASNRLPARSIAVSDGIAPEVSSSKYTSRDTVELTFSEPVRLSSGSTPAGWSATGADVASTTAGSAISVLTTSATATSATLTLDNDLVDKTRLTFTLSYDGGAGNIEDESGNALASYSDSPSDGIAPRITSAVSSALNAITVTFSEDVDATSTSAGDTWTLGGADRPTGVTVDRNPPVSTGTTVLGLSGDLGEPIGTVTLTYNDGTGDAEDKSDNALATQTVAVTQDLAPAVSSAKVAGPDRIVIEYSEPVTAVAADYMSLVVDGQARDVSGLSGGTTDTHTITFSGGDPFGTDALGSISIEAASVQDATNKALGTGSISQPLSDGQSPTVSAKYTARNSVALEFSEPVRLSSGGNPTGWGVAGIDAGTATGASSISVITASNTDTSATLTLNGDLADKTLLDFTLSYAASGNIEDDDGNALAAYSATPDDGIAPAVSSAKYTSRNMVDLTFSEPVRLSSAGAPTGWTATGTDVPSTTAGSVITVITTSVTSTSATITLDNDLADKTLLDFTLAYAASGNIEDQGGNALAAYSAKPTDGFAPRVSSAKVTGPNEITIVYSETVTHNVGYYNNVNVGGNRFLSSFSGDNTDTAVMRFAGGAVGTDATGSVALTSASIRDGSGNALSSGSSQQITDGQAPTFTAKATALDKITVTFSENLTVLDTTAQGWSISGGDAGGRTVDSSTAASDGNSVVLTLSSDMDDTKPDGVVLRYKTSSGDVSGDPGSGSGAISDPASNKLAAESKTVSDGIAPEVSSTKYVSRSSVVVAFSEPVKLSGNNPTGWRVSGADKGDATGADSFGAITTSVAVSSDTLILNNNLADKTRLDFTLSYASGNLEDAEGNDLKQYSDKPSDGFGPVVVSAESRELNQITVTFSEKVTATGTSGDGGWRLSGADSGSLLVSSRSDISNVASDSLTLMLSGNLNDPIGTVTLAYDATGDVEDESDNALASQTVAVSQDLAPAIASAEATAPDEITVTFSETVTGSATDADDTWKLHGADSAGRAVTGYPGTSSNSVTLDISPALTTTSPELRLQYVRSPGDIQDTTGTPLESTQPPHAAVSDGLAPALSSASLNEGTGVLALTFTEIVDISEMAESSIYVRESGSSSGGVALSSSARTTASDSATVSFTLSESDRQAVIAMATPQLDMGAGAASDPISNPSAAAADRPISATRDTVAPQIQSATLDEGAGTVSLTFNERMAAPTAEQAARIAIGTGGADISFAEADIASATLDGAGTTVTITVSEAKRQEIIAAAPADIDMLSGGLRDVSGAQASSAGTAFDAVTPDTGRPDLASAVLNTDDGVLVLSFSETMDASSFAGELSKVSVATPSDPVRLAGTARADGTNIVVTLDDAVIRSLLAVISAAPNAGAPGLLSLQVPGAAPQFTDTSGNAVTSVSGNILIEDGRPPSLVSASVTSSDTIVVRFSEDLADDTVQTSDFTIPGYDISSVSEMSGTVTITMANPETFTVRDAPGVRTAGPVSDLFGNVLEPGARIQSVNAIVPVLISQFTVQHDGPAKAGDRIQITFRAQYEVAMDAALRVNGQAVATASVPNGFEATYTVPSGAPQGPLKLHVEIISNTGTPTEFSERHLTGPNVTVDTLPPSVVSASISGIDSVTITYDEPVTVSASHYTGIEADGAAPVDASGVIGSGSKSVLISWSGAGATPSAVRLTAGAAVDSAGNPAVPSQVTAAAAQTEVTLDEPGIPLARGTVVGTVTAPSGIEPVVDVSSFTGTVTDAAVIGAGGGSAVFESELRIVTRTFGLPDATFPAGTQAGGLGPITSDGVEFAEAIAISSSSSTVHLSEDQRELYPMLFDGTTTTVQVGHPDLDIIFDRPVLLEFDIPLRGALVFSVGTLGVPLPIPACDPSWDTSALPVGQSVPEGWPPGTYDANACVDESSDSVWTGHFSLFGVSQPPPRGGSECDDCTPPTLGYDEYGARLVDGGFSYNGLASDVEYFFTPYPLIESEVGKENTVVLKMYENEGPGNVSHAALAFGLRSGEVISESRAVINYDIAHDGIGTVSAIDPDGAIDLDTLSAEHETVQCSAGSELECLQITINHTFRAPLEFDIVGTDVWDSQRNSWQNYYNHGIKITGEPLDGRPGIEVNGGELVLHPISPDSTNRDVMVSSDGQLFKLSPDGRYMPLSNQSRLYHDIDESMYLYDGEPMQGYDRGDPEFRDHLYAQVLAAQKALDSMMPAPQPDAPAPAPQLPDLEADAERLRAAVLAEQARAALLFEELFGHR